MKNQPYLHLWKNLRVPLSTLLTRLRDELESSEGLAGNFHFVPVTFDTQASHFQATLLIKDSRDMFGPALASVHLKLHDESLGCNVSLHVQSGVLAKTSEWSYCPYNYARAGLTRDLSELERRIEDMPFNMLRIATQNLLKSLATLEPA